MPTSPIRIGEAYDMTEGVAYFPLVDAGDMNRRTIPLAGVHGLYSTHVSRETGDRMTKTFNWKIYFILLGAAAFGLVAILPYSLALQAATLKKVHLPLPLPLLVTIQILEQLVLFGIAIAIGLFFANRTGLGTPLLEARLKGESVSDRIRAMAPISIILGVLAALLIIALDVYVFQPALKAELGGQASALSLSGAATPAAWKGFLASFYGGFDEEILLRLCVMSFLAWLGRFLARTADGRPTTVVFWVANLLAAILFGLGHLPATALLLPLTPLVILRAVILNGLAGIAFGYLYFTRGLESAMLSHFTGDLILHVLFAL
jgi:membrane protease YdiL (CAAX protease family)